MRLPTGVLISSLFLGLLLAHAADAAEPKPKPDAEPGEPRTGLAGSADAAAAFARQAGNAPAPVGAIPAVQGAYVWGGRADEKYKPFFQWDLRLKAGSATLAGLRGRTVTLNPDGTDAAVGSWFDFAAIPAGETLDVSLRQNCPTFGGYRLELTWDTSGKATYVAADKTTLPMSTAEFATMAYLVTTGYMHNPDESVADRKKRGNKPFEVSWYVWNIGGTEATEIVQTVRFLDLHGKEVHREKVMSLKSAKGGARLQQKLDVKEPPKGYQLLSVSAECATPMIAMGPDASTFTGAKEVEIVGIALADGKLSAKVRNGLDRNLSGLVINITLLDEAGKEVEKVALPAGELASGADVAVSAPAQAKTIMGYEIGWDVSGKAAPNKADTASGAAPAGSIDVDGVSFTVQGSAAEGGTLFVKGQVENKRDAALAGLTVTLTAAGAAPVTWTCDSLDPGQPMTIALEFSGISALESLSMTWKSGAP